MITVRPIVPGDVEPLARHVKPTPLLHTARSELQRHGRALYLIALDDTVPLGHALLKFPPLGSEHPRLNGVPEVEDLYVAEGVRSNGIGTRLLNEAEERALAHGYTRTGLAVGVENTRAQQLYERTGYTDASLGEFWVDGAREVCRYLVKEL